MAKAAAAKTSSAAQAHAQPAMKAEGKAKAKRAYRFRMHVPAPAPVQARNRQKQLAMLARPGSWRLCPQCGYPRYIPRAAKCHYACAMPRVPYHGGAYVRKCDFDTSAQAWNCQDISSEAYAVACSEVITDLVLSIDTRCQAGDLACHDAWATQRTELPQRVAAAADARPPAQPPLEG